MKKLVLLLFLIPLLNVWGQVSPQKAREILGERFISRQEASVFWSKLTYKVTNDQEIGATNAPEEIIPYSETTLRKCLEKNTNGSDFYLVPVFGLNTSDLAMFWKIHSPALPLKVSGVGWRLVDFSSNPEMYFSWQEEKDEAARQGLTLLSALDYLEVSATISLTRGKDKTSNYKKFFFSTENLVNVNNAKADKAIIFAANLQEKEALILDFPRECFIPALIKPEEISYIILGDKQTTFSSVCLKNYLKLPPEGIDYQISVIRWK